MDNNTQDNVLLTSSDFEAVMEDLNFQQMFKLSPLQGDENYGCDENIEVTESLPQYMNPPLMQQYGGGKNDEVPDSMPPNMNPPLLQQYGGGNNDKVTDSMPPNMNPPLLQSYIGVQEINDTVETAELMQNTTAEEIPSSSSSPTCTIPCRDLYPGPFNFEVFLDSETSSRRSWVYSHKLHKVFIDMNKSLLVQFRINNYSSSRLRVRALPVYSSADYVSVPVQRCTLHELSIDPYRRAHSKDHRICYCIKHGLPHHVVQSSHSQAQYDYNCESGRHSVVVPLGIPQAGSETVFVEYHFTCKTSCSQGMNRKPIDVIFTLESEQHEVVGRFILPVKICSCPKRDKDKEEADAILGNIGTNTFGGKRRVSTTERDDSAKKFKTETSQIERGNNGSGLAPNNPELPEVNNGNDRDQSSIQENVELTSELANLSKKIDALSADFRSQSADLRSQLADLRSHSADQSRKIDAQSRKTEAMSRMLNELLQQKNCM